MKTSRQLFKVDADTGTWVDTGPPFEGRVLQTRWIPSTGDTGGDLDIVLTQSGVVIASETDSLGSAFTRVYKQEEHRASGAVTDTGHPGEFIVSSGESMRVTVTPGGAAVVGDLYIWTDR